MSSARRGFRMSETMADIPDLATYTGSSTVGSAMGTRKSLGRSRTREGATRDGNWAKLDNLQLLHEHGYITDTEY